MRDAGTADGAAGGSSSERGWARRLRRCCSEPALTSSGTGTGTGSGGQRYRLR